MKSITEASSFNAKCKYGFTLAEVLITLGVIGVVAALTMPTFISNYKKSVVENSLKKAFALLNEIIKTSEVYNDSHTTWDYSDSKQFTEQYILPYVKTVKVCGNGYNSSGCFKTKDGRRGWIQLNNSYSHSDDSYKMILSDGMSIGINVESKLTAKFFVDINGPNKGNSRIGEDIFIFELISGNKDSHASGWYYNQKGLIPGSQCKNALGHINASLETLLYDTNCRGGCNPNATNANSRQTGEACSAVIVKNGWKIPDNYPIKF